MTALSSDRKTIYREGIEIAYKVAAGAKIHAGSLVCLNSGGYAVPGADTAGFKFLGIAMERADNTSGANGSVSVRVRRKGIFRLASSGMTIADLGVEVKIADDQTVAKTTSNSVVCGTVAEFISAIEVGVDVDMR
ncbi:MAG: capsid cement protein [Syntrophobacteraceae bacterium]